MITMDQALFLKHADVTSEQPAANILQTKTAVRLQVTRNRAHQYAFGKPKDTLDLNVEERRVINIIPFTPTEKQVEPKEEQAEEKLPLPEEPPVRHLAPVNERRTYGPAAWPGRNPRW